MIKKQLTACAMIGALGVSAASALAAGSKICWEAESAVSIESPIRSVLSNADINVNHSGRGFLEIPWDGNKTKGIGQAGYHIKVANAGIYYLWARTYWANGCGNSIAVQVNGGSPIVLGQDGTYDRWHWVTGGANATRVHLNAGTNTVVLKNRETGVRIDEFYLSQDADYVPTGIRKATQ